MIRVCVQAEDFDPGEEIGRLHQARFDIGAVASFIGLVRGKSSDETLNSLLIEHFPGMTQRELERMGETAKSRWNLQAVSIVHRYGEVLPGERIVFVATASEHRHPAFEACAFLMDYLKTKAPFWKQERCSSGAVWVEPRESDDAALAKWSLPG